MVQLKKMKYQCDSITPVALASSICLSPRLPLFLAVHPPAFLSQYSSTEPSVWGQLFTAFSSPRILSSVTNTHTHSASTKKPATMQSLLAVLSTPNLPVSHFSLSFSATLHVHVSLTMGFTHTYGLKNETLRNDWLQLLWQFVKKPLFPEPVNELCNRIFPRRECASKER